MRMLARGTAITFASLASVTPASVSTNAADLSYPPPVVAQPQYGQPQYGIAPPPAAAPPAVIIVPGPAAYPQYPGARVAAPPIGTYPYGTPAPIPPAPIPPAPIPPGAGVVPPANCPPDWRCDARGCGWVPACAPLPRYGSDEYDAPGRRYFDPRSPGPQVYGPQVYDPQYDPQYDRQVYVRPDAPPPPEQYPGPYSQDVYPGPTDPYPR